METFGNIPLVIFYNVVLDEDALNGVSDKVAEAVVLVGGIKGWLEFHKDLADPVLQFPYS